MIKFIINLFKHDILRKIVALFFAILLYFAVSDRVHSEMKLSNIFVEIEYPEGISSLSPNKIPVSIYCSGSKRMLKALQDGLINGEVKIPINRFVEGQPYLLKIEEDMFNLPFGVTYISAEPNEIPLVLEKNITKKVPVDTVFDENKLPIDYRINRIIVNPKEIVISGPRSVVEPINAIRSNEIPLDKSVKENFDYKVALNIPNGVIGNISEVDTSISVHREFSTKTIENVPIHIQINSNDNSRLSYELLRKNINVIVRASNSEIAKVNINHLRAFVDIGDLTTPGTYDIAVQCFVLDPKALEIQEIVPQKIQIVVRAVNR